MPKVTFPFSLQNVQIECSQCQHQLEGSAQFGLDIIRCGNCGKFNQVTSRAEVAHVKTPVKREA